MQFKETTLKGLVHLALAAVAGWEASMSSTPTRKFLNGCAMGWHLHCTLYHLLYEPKEKP